MWAKLRQWFKDSEIIFWARLQILLGAVIEIITAVDPFLLQPILGDYFPYFLIVNGLLTEILRRRRSTL